MGNRRRSLIQSAKVQVVLELLEFLLSCSVIQQNNCLMGSFDAACLREEVAASRMLQDGSAYSTAAIRYPVRPSVDAEASHHSIHIVGNELSDAVCRSTYRHPIG